MRRFSSLLLLALVGCGVPPTVADQPVQGSLPPTTTIVPTTTTAPTQPTLVPTAPATPTSVPTAPATPTSATPSSTATAGVVSGTIMLPAAPTLPADAELTIRLKGGLPIFYYPESETLGEQKIRVAAGTRVPFTFTYDPANTSAFVSYTVFAEVLAGGQRVLTGAQEAITMGTSKEVALELHPLPSAREVRGTVKFPTNRQLPPGASLVVRLEAPVDGVGASTVLGEHRFTPTGTAPLAYTIPIDPATLDPFAAYTVHAVVDAPGRLSWLSQFQLVLTHGSPTTADLQLKAPENTKLLEGTATFQSDVLLPPDAKLTVQMVQVHKGVPRLPERNYTTTFSGSSARYTLEYVPASLEYGEYALYGAVRQGEKLLLTTPLLPLDGKNMPQTQDIQLTRPANIGTVRGTLTIANDQPLPPNAEIFVQLADMQFTVGDGSPVVLATQVLRPTQQPQQYAIDYDPVLIDPQAIYSVFANIRAEEAVLGTSEWQQVITSGKPTTVDLVLK